MKTKIILGLTLSSLLFFVYFIFKDHYSFSYYYSPDKKSVVTLIHYYNLLEYKHEKSYLSSGYLTDVNELTDYVEINRTHAFVLHFQGDTCILYSHELPYTIVGHTRKIILKYPLEEKGQWKKMTEDESGQYIFKTAGDGFN